MTLFQTNAIAWSKWTSQFQARMPNTAPTIFQANTVMASLDCRTGWSGLNLYRGMLAGDRLPTFTRANSGANGDTGMTLSDDFEQYLLQLNVEMRKKAPGTDRADAARKLTKYNRALDAGEQARGRSSSSANQISPASAFLNSLKELNGTKQRFSVPSHRVQCLLFTWRMFVVPPSGSILSSSLKSTVLPFACSFSARFLVASIIAFDDHGIPHRAVASSRPSAPLRTIGAL
ncbi:hypothetical protein ACVW1A_000007 [Bradyrhizobium sp. LB1.3]